MKHKESVICIVLLLIAVAIAFAGQSGTYASNAVEAGVQGVEAASLEAAFDQSWILAFAGIFLLGLALNLTPCVYPMLTITVSIFSDQKESSGVRVVSRALLYVLGIATMYSILGVAAALTGGIFGGILQSRVVLIGIGVLFFVLALSMFGLYELNPPSRLVNKFGSRQSAGLAGIYISGLFVGIFAAPCIGPPIIGLLAMVGHRGDPLFGFLAFFILSLGLGFPYLLLGIFSNLIKKLPKSGDWMVWVRKLMGVLLVSVGLFYFSLAVSPGLALILIPLVLIAGGVYLGYFEKSRGNTAAFLWFKRVFGAALSITGVFLLYQGQIPSLEWDNYDSARFNPQGGEPALIYFTADWCVPCLEMDRRTFTDTGLIRKLDNIEKVKVDLTHYNSPESIELRQRFNIAGVPTIVFLDGDKEIKSQRIVGFVSAGEMLSRIQNADRIIAAGGPYDAPFEERQDNLSQIRLISDSAWIQPGVPFRLGALFLLRDRWHVYWINPGDSGTAPLISWNIPEEFEAGEITWPAPQRFNDPPFATFGHEDELLLARKIVPPSNLKSGSNVRFSIDGSWLVCDDDICVGQNGSAELVMEVSDQPSNASGSRYRFDDAELMLPVSDAGWKFRARLEPKALILNAVPPDTVTASIMQRSEFFPEQAGILRSVRSDWARTEDGYSMRMIREALEPESIFRGVLVLPEGMTPRVIEVNVPFD